MAYYIISYDLNKAGQDYKRIEGAIKGLGTATKLLETVWLLNSDKSSIYLKTFLGSYIDDNDEYIISQINWIEGRVNDALAKIAIKYAPKP